MKFFRHGKWRFSLDEISAYVERDDGTVTVEFDRRTPIVLEGDDAAAFVGWADGEVLKEASAREPAPAVPERPAQAHQPLITKGHAPKSKES